MTDEGKFLSELKSLLEKYNATIEFEVDEYSDTFGINGERFLAYFYKRNDNGFLTVLKEVPLCDGWSLSSSDIQKTV